MSIVAGLLTSGCQKGSSLEQFTKQISSAKSIRAEATLKLGSKTRPVSILRKLPNQAKTTSQKLIALVNDKDGWLEVDGDANKYATIPWGGEILPQHWKARCSSGDRMPICVRSHAASNRSVKGLEAHKGGRKRSLDYVCSDSSWTSEIRV